MIQQAQAPNIAPEVQQFLHRYHLTELQPSFNVDSSPHLRVQCNHCSHKFNLQTRQITAMMGTKISTPDYTFTFCPSCRHTSKFLVNHIMLRKQILSRAGILLPTYVSSAIQHTDVVEVKYKKGKLTAAIQMTAFELAYGSINDISNVALVVILSQQR